MTEQISDLRAEKPRKRIFIALLAGACALVIVVATLLWWVPNVGMGNIHPVLPILFGAVVWGISIVIVAGLGLLILTLLTGRDLFVSRRLRGLVIKYLFPGVIGFGRMLGIDRDTLQQSFVALNNQLVRARSLRVEPDRAMILLPHCIQLFDCDIKITGEVKKCIRCGKCDIKDLVELAYSYGIDIAVATGGTIARKLIVEKRPKFILAVACERDLTSGIRDAYPLPVIGVLNRRPNGPCFNTSIMLPEVQKALDEHIIT